jgi:zinc protease
MMDDPRVAQPSVHRSYLVPSYTTAKREEAEALDVLAQLLGAGSNSRLYRRLVVDKRLATNAGASYQGSALDSTRLGVYAMPQPGVDLPDLENEIDAVIAEIVVDGVASEELERAKTRMIADAIYAQDNQSSMARWFGVALSTGSTVQDVLNWPDRIKAISAAQVQNAAKTWLDKRRSATGYLVKSLPAPEEKRS